MIQIWDSGNVIVPVGYCPFGAYHHAEEYKSGQSGQKKSYGLQKAMIWGPLKRQHGHVSTRCGQNQTDLNLFSNEEREFTKQITHTANSCKELLYILVRLRSDHLFAMKLSHECLWIF